MDAVELCIGLGVRDHSVSVTALMHAPQERLGDCLRFIQPVIKFLGQDWAEKAKKG